MKSMLIIDITYTAPLDVIEEYLAEHRAFLGEYYDEGMLLASGPKNPRDGGIIVAIGTRAEAEAFIQEDPYHKAGVAEYAITEFEPVKHAKMFETFL